jgi:hypothetical protein
MIKENCVTAKDKKIGNFTVNVLREVDIITEGETAPHVEIDILFDDGSLSNGHILSLNGPNGLAKLNWYELHPHIILHQSETKARQNLMNYIRAALPNLSNPKETRHRIAQLGTHIIDGEPIFSTGGGLIRKRPPPDSPERADVVLEPQRFKIDIDPNLSELEAIAEMVKAVCLDPDIGRVVLAHSLLYIMREVYKSAWKAPRCSLFLYNESGQLKTTYATLLTQLHNRGDGIAEPVRLDATIAAAETVLYEKSGCAVILDDLFPVKHRDMTDEQEKTLIKITRIIGDGVGRAKMNGKQVLQRTPTVGVIFTGEYLVGVGSTAARLLPIRSAYTIDDVKMRECLSNRLAVSTFYHFFIVWYIENYAEIQRLLEMWWEKYTKTDMGVHRRLRETHFFINTAYKLFLRYCAEKFPNARESEVHHSRAFEDYITRLVQEQDVRVKQGNDNGVAKVEPFEQIREWHRTKSFHLLSEKKVYPLEGLGTRLRGYDGLKHNGLLCLCGDALLAKFQQLGHYVDRTSLRNSLVAHNALKLDREGKNYKVGNMRFYGICLSKLK